MKICCDQGCNDIEVVVATKWSHYLLCLHQYFSLGTVLPKSITGAFSSKSRLDVREVKKESIRALSRYFGIKFSFLNVFFFGLLCINCVHCDDHFFISKVFIVGNTVKKGKSWCLAVICRKRCAFDMQIHLIVVSIFLKTWLKDHGDSSGQLLQRRIWLVCIMALLLAVL